MKGGVYILIALIVLMTVATVITSSYPYLQAKIAPILAGGIILILSIVEMIKELRIGKVPSLSAPSKKEVSMADAGKQSNAYLREGGWMVGFWLVIYLVGFIVGIAAFTTAYAKAHKTGWPASITVGVLIALLSYLLFSYLVETELYPGIILRQLGLAG